MFKEEIKKLAALQVAERQARHAMKASDAPRRVPPRPLAGDGTPKSYYGMSKEERRQYEEAWKLVAPYHEWFVASSHRRHRRRSHIRIRHLLDAFRRGVPYKVVESHTTTELEHLAYWLTQALLHFEPSREDRACNDVRAWLGAKPYLNPWMPTPSPRFATEVLGLAAQVAPQPAEQPAP